MILACDPGAKGAFAWVSDDGHLVEIADMPTVTVRDKLRVSAQGVAELFRKRTLTVIVIEGVGSRPKEGAAGAFAFGYAAGLVEGVAAGAGLPVSIIPAAVWKRKAGVSADKGAARQMAMRFWPGASDLFKRVKDHDRAEAALLARWTALGSQR